MTVGNVAGSITIISQDGSLLGTTVNASDDYNDFEVTLDDDVETALATYSELNNELVVTSLDKTLTYESTPVLYSVNFRTYGGNSVDAQMNLASGSLVAQPEAPTLAGCIFAGWYKDAVCTDGQEWDFGAETITANMELYAKWDINETYTKQLTFKAEGSEDILILVKNGDTLDSVPEVPERYAYEGEWDTTDFSNITVDKITKAIYSRITDFNDDGHIDMLVIVLMAQNYGSGGFFYDLNEDTVVNIYDLVTIAQLIQ